MCGDVCGGGATQTTGGGSDVTNAGTEGVLFQGGTVLAGKFGGGGGGKIIYSLRL